MKFEWDNNKNEANKLKHGISFEDTKELWNDPSRIEIQTSFPDEDRYILIGRLGEKIFAAVYTIREESIRIISARRAGKREVLLYDKKEGR